MAGELGKASLELRADYDKLKNDFSRAEGIATSSINKLGLLLATYVSFQTLTTTLTASWRAAGEAATAMAQLEARIRSTGGAAGVSAVEITEMARGLQAITTFGDDAIISMNAMLLSFTNIKGDIVPEATRAILDMSAAFYGLDANAQTLQQTAIQVGKALQDPIEGVTALQRVGIRLTEQQKEQVKAFVEMNDVASAQRLILKELDIEFGGTAEALRATPWGEAKALAETFGDTLEGVGNNIAKILHPALKGLNDELTEFNQNGTGLVTTLLALSPAGLIGLTASSISAINEAVKANKEVSDKIIESTDGIATGWNKAAVAAGEYAAMIDVAVKKQDETFKNPPPAPVTRAFPERENLIFTDIGRTREEFEEGERRRAEFLVEASEMRWRRETELAEQSFAEINEISENAAQAMQNAFEQFFFDPFHYSLEDLGNAIRRFTANLLAEQLTNQIKSSIFWASIPNEPTPSPKVPFANGGVVSTPTLFPMARGMGLMGEAGAEAVMPLSRGRDGKLGVESSGQSIRIINAFNDDHIGDFLQSAQGERIVLNIISKNAGNVQRMIG